jgi:GNAT superfamily N-acetyltransferase
MQTLRECGPDDVPRILDIVNAAAAAYRNVIPADCFHDPYMTANYLRDEIERGVRFLGCEADGVLVGVMGLQSVGDVELIRHAYVWPAAQGGGIGAVLIGELVRRSTGALLVGTWAAAHWAIRFYQRNGFTLAPPDRAAALLARYWNISERQAQTSVVLERAARAA